MIRRSPRWRKALIYWALGLATGLAMGRAALQTWNPCPSGPEAEPPQRTLDLQLPKSTVDLDNLRAASLVAVFGRPTLPTRGPEAVDPVPVKFKKVVAAERLTVVTAAGASHPIFLRAGGDHLAVYHAGHDQDPIRDAQQPIQALLEAGFDVLAIAMPQEPHARLQGLPRPLEPFLEPVAVSLNHALANGRYQNVVMLGLSGGGWTTVVYSALDPRVRRSYPVAGSLPIALRGPRDTGDFEQALPGLPVDYPTLYLMASTEGRQQLQIFNRLDPCCFAGDAALGYAGAIGRRSEELAGRFEVLVIEHDVHEVPPALLTLARGF